MVGNAFGALFSLAVISDQSVRYEDEWKSCRAIVRPKYGRLVSSVYGAGLERSRFGCERKGCPTTTTVTVTGDGVRVYIGAKGDLSRFTGRGGRHSGGEA